jgi:hypothetical protein
MYLSFNPNYGRFTMTSSNTAQITEITEAVTPTVPEGPIAEALIPSPAEDVSVSIETAEAMVAEVTSLLSAVEVPAPAPFDPNEFSAQLDQEIAAVLQVAPVDANADSRERASLHDLIDKVANGGQAEAWDTLVDTLSKKIHLVNAPLVIHFFELCNENGAVLKMWALFRDEKGWTPAACAFMHKMVGKNKGFHLEALRYAFRAGGLPKSVRERLPESFVAWEEAYRLATNTDTDEGAVPRRLKGFYTLIDLAEDEAEWKEIFEACLSYGVERLPSKLVKKFSLRSPVKVLQALWVRLYDLPNKSWRSNAPRSMFDIMEEVEGDAVRCRWWKNSKVRIPILLLLIYIHERVWLVAITSARW